MDEHRRALIIFARKPEAGKVKTRLAATLGNDKALDIYIKLLEHTRRVAAAATCDKYVFLTEPKHDDFWDGFTDEMQQGDTLGARMQHSFQFLFEKGYNHVLIIGSDCPGLDADIISKGFEELNEADIVIGPATDGGYYLLGMDKMHPSLFQNKSWSTGTVFDDTISDINAAGLSFFTLPGLSDVDEEKDIPAAWL